MAGESTKTSQELERDDKGRLLPGQQSLNPNGRPRGKTLKEWAREKLMNMSDEQKEEFVKTLPKDILWRMAEGNPSTESDVNVKATLNITVPPAVAEAFNLKHDTNTDTGESN